MTMSLPDGAHLASQSELERVAAIGDPICAVLRNQSPAQAVNVMVYVCAQTMLNLSYHDDSGPVAGWDIVAQAIRKSIDDSDALLKVEAAEARGPS